MLDFGTAVGRQITFNLLSSPCNFEPGRKLINSGIQTVSLPNVM